MKTKLIKTVNTLLTTFVCLLLLNTPSHAVETTTYYHHDGLGSTVAASDVDGNLLWREDYQPYGTRVRNPSNAGDNTLWYTGKPEEPSLGMQYFGARWYDPVVGRFSGIDPVGVQEGNIHSFNRYAYANNNPYLYTDPDGRFSIIEAGIVVVVIFVAAVAIQSSTTFNAVNNGPLAYSNPGAGSNGIFTSTPSLPAGNIQSNPGIEAADPFGPLVYNTKTGTKGASGDLTTPSGNIYTGNSARSSITGGDARAPMNPQTQDALDAVQNPSVYHGNCCEIDGINKALNAGDSVRGAKMGPVTNNATGETLGACSTCREVKKTLGVE